MSGPKGIITDLTSISSLLSTILDQTNEIFSKAEGAAGSVGKVAGGSAASGGLGTTKRGSGSQSLGLANVPAATGGSGMVGATGMQEPRIAEPTGGSGMAGAAGMLSETKFSGSSAADSTTGGKTSGGKGGKALGIMGAVASGLGIVANVAADGMNMMPDVNTVMNRGASFYHAGIEQGNRFSSTAMQNNAQSNGLFATGQSGSVTDYMSSMGLNFGSSSWNSVSKETANAYKYLNMDPMAAAQAYTGLNSGGTSASLMRTMGVSTSDTKGNSLSAEQIFSQLDSRLMQKGVNYSASDVNNNWLKGGLQASLQNMGLSSDQQELYRQHLLNKVQGKPTDMSSSATLDSLVSGATKAGNENPLAPQQAINASQEKLYQSYQQPYLDGIKAAVPLIQAMNSALEGVPAWAKAFKAQMDTLAGNKGISGAAAAGTDLIGGVAAGVGSILGGKAISSLFKKGKSATKTGSTAVESTAKAAESASTKIAAKTAVKIGGKSAGAASKLIPGLDILTAGIDATSGVASGLKASADDNGSWKKDPWGSLAKQAGADIQTQGPVLTGLDILTGGLFSGNTTKYASRLVGSQLPDYLNPNTAVGKAGIGRTMPLLGAVNGFSSWLNGFASGTGSSGSTVGTAAAGSGGTISFILPVNGKITDGFGPRSASSTGGIGSTFHRGIDIAAPMGTPIHAGASGKVSAVGLDGSFGYRVMIDHAGGYQSIYAHQPSGGPTVSVGQVVKQGDLIGHVGSTGASTGPHCHFEVRLNGTAINPAPLIGAATPVKDSPPATSQTATTQQQAPPTLSLLRASDHSQSDIVGSISQAMPQFASPGSANAGFGAQTTGSAGAPAPLVASNQMAKGYGTGAGGVGGSNQSSMSVPGARYYKQGDDYVAQDSHVNVHAGEAILNAEAADEWRAAKAGGKKAAPQVIIHLSIQDASDAEARKFANRVKQYLSEDALDTAMGHH